MKTILNYDDFLNESIHNYTPEKIEEFRKNMSTFLTEEQIDQVLNSDTEYTTQGEEVFESKLQDDYREFFTHLLDLYEVKSPNSIKDEECKKEFFNKVNKGWVKGSGLSEYGKKLMDCECLDENGECCDKKED